MTDISAELTDFGETAAVIDNLDLVITVDTAMGHLAGALGKTVWIMLPKASDWRWMLNRADSPWYPSARLFRQQTPGAWDSVIAEVTAALTERLRAPAETPTQQRRRQHTK
jgi:ADP-heptose:LPS heptosyltransferase